MELDKLLELIRNGENEKVEFKRKITNEIGRDVCAFANTRGGTIIIGISDNGQIVGVKKDENIYNMVSSVSPLPKLEIEKVHIGKKRIVVVTVRPSKNIHSFRGIVYIRVGSINRPLDIKEIIERSIERRIVDWDSLITDEPIDRIDEKEWERLKRNGLTQLEKLKLVQEEKLTNAGVLILHKNPKDIIYSAYIDIIEKNNGEVEDRRIIEFPAVKALEAAYGFIIGKIKKRINIRGLRHVVLVPKRALREALINAIVHRNYMVDSPIKVVIEEDHIEIMNPGSIPDEVDLDKPIHIPRNKILSDVFYRLGFIEKLGEGLTMIKQDVESKGWTVEIIRRGITHVIFKYERKGLNEIEARILSLGENINSRMVAHILGVSRKTAVKYINSLMEKGYLQKIGQGKSTRYQIVTHKETHKGNE